MLAPQEGETMADTPSTDPGPNDSDTPRDDELRADADRRTAWNSTVDDLLPDPSAGPHHVDDAAGPDPYDARDDVDVLVPPATGAAEDETDDFSTQEELDVDNAPAGHNPEHEDPGAGSGEIRSPGVDEASAGERTADESFGAFERIAPPDPGTTTCPVCGQATDALRFCGYCGSPLTEQRREIIGDTPVQRAVSYAEGFLQPVTDWTKPGAVRAILAGGFLLILLSLLANSAAAALIVGASILPIAILYWCRKLDVFENEPIYIIAGFGVVGAVVGALLGWLGAFTTMASWFDEGVLNFGAAGFGGRFAEAAGTAPFIVWMIVGVLVPTVALATIVASPLLARRFTPLGNEVMDGLTVAAAMGAGYAIGTAAVFVAPMFGQQGPPISPSAWTLTTIGLTIVRPVIWTLAAAMIGAGAWRYLFTGKLATALAPVGLGVAAPLLHALLSIQLAAIGLWAELVVGLAFAVVVAVLYRRTLADAIVEDRRVLGSDGTRVVCPSCHKVTPAGQFCAHCGEALPAAAA